jgi:hypothetical protein
VDLTDLPERIRRRLTITDDHWRWTGQLNNKGYGLVHFEGTKRAAHVVVYTLLVGPVPAGLQLDHLCEFKDCCRVGCLEPVTPKENQQRASARQTHCRRAGHPRTPENTYRNPRTGRTSCRACARERDVARTPRRRGARWSG